MSDQMPPSILYVDDDADNRLMTALCLREAGFNVREATTGGEALWLVRDKPDLVILDVHLPDISGFEVCRRIKADPAAAATPVLHLTGVARTSQEKAQGLEGGADGYLTKPVEPEEIVAHVKALLRIRQAEEAARAAARQWQTTFDAIRDVICLVDRDGRILRCNRGLADLFGKAPGQLVGRCFRQLVTATLAAGQLLPFASPSESHARHVREQPIGSRWFHTTADPVFDQEGLLTGTVHVWVDITGLKKAEEMQAEHLRLAAFSVDVGLALTGIDTLQGMLRRAAEAMVRHLNAALARIWTLNPETDTLELQASAGLHTHVDGPHGRVPVGHLKIGLIALERRPHWTNDVLSDPRIHDKAWARREGMVAFAGRPLLVAGELVGVLGIFCKQLLTDFTLKALEAAADSIALGIQRKRVEGTLLLNEHDFRIARQIQQKLFPRTGPRVSGFDIGGAAFPAVATGGDYFDYIPLHDGTLALVIGDVAGHGVGPAMVMASIRAYLRALARTHVDVSEILTMVNNVLTEDTDERFVTLLLARLDPRSCSLVYASGGHQTGYIVGPTGEVQTRLESTGMPLGILADAEFPASPAITLRPGEMVLFLTDGLVEACCPDGEAFGTARVLEVIRLYRQDPAARIVKNLYHAARAFSQETAQLDDMCAVVIKVDAPGLARTAP